jgi:hypothetical protein
MNGSTNHDSSDPQASTIGLLIGVGAIVVIAAVIGLQALFLRSEEGELVRKVEAQEPAELARLQAGQAEKLTAYRWVDARKGIVAIPIERAMEVAVAEARRAPAAAKEVKRGRRKK